MISKFVYIFILICLLSTELYYLFYFCKASWFYFTDGADIRVCTMAQFIMYGIFFTIEVVSYLISGKETMLLIYACRSHFIFSYFLLASCRLVGYRVMYSSSLTRNILYIVICYLFYIVVISGIVGMPFNDVSLYSGSFQLISKVSTYVKFNPTSIKSIVFCLIPIIYSVICYVIILSFDLIEKRSRKTIYMDVILGISIVLAVIVDVGTVSIYLDNLLLCFMYLIPIFGFIYEAKSVVRICQFTLKDDLKFKKLVKDSIGLPLIRRKYNARFIAKLIKSKPSLKDSLPKGKKYVNFNNLVNSYIK